MNENVLRTINKNIHNTKISLSNLGLTELPPEISQLTKLRSLDLSQNKLTRLPPEIFQLTNLTNLDLSQNKLTQLPPEISQLTKLRSLDLSQNKLTRLPPEIFQLTNLTNLDLSQNKLTQLPPEISQLTKLRSLNLSQNKLTELPPEIFQLTNLTILDLSHNGLKKLPPEISQLTKLSSLNFSRNKLTKLPPEIFQLTNLTILDLWGNKLTQLPPEISHLTNLTRLDLSHNGLKKLPPEISQLTNLTELDMSLNRLTELPPEIIQLTNLTELELWGNELTELPSEISELTNLTELDLSQNRLTELPPEIIQLTNLTNLDLWGNELIKLPPEIFQLTNLTELDLSRNKLTKLPPEIVQLTNLTNLELSDNVLTKLPQEIFQLTNLIRLNLSGNKLIKLPPEIVQLTQLLSLDLSHSGLTKFPHEIVQLTNLADLDLSGNELTKLPPEIFRLTHLKTLSLSQIGLRELPPEIVQLTSLTRLDLSQNGLIKLPPEIVQLTSLTNLDLSKNPIESPPLEIANQGFNAIKAYFESIEKEEKYPLNEVKVLLVGDGGSGKTSLVKRILGKTFNPNESQTHGIKIQDWEITESAVNIHVHFWDFGGQQIMHATHQFFLSKRSLYILVLDGRKEEDAEYWLKHIESFGGNSPILIVLNKIDEHPSFDVNRFFLKEKYEGIKGFYPISCRDNTGFTEFSKSLKQALSQVELLHTTWPISWFTVKTCLETMTNDYISFKEYNSICLDSKITGDLNQTSLLSFLNDLGVVLHFRDIELLDTHVLNPKWITEAVYRIINSNELAINKGILNLHSLEKILAPRDDTDPFFPPDKFQYIINLMKKFELCYEIDSDRILIPDLLEIQKPELELDYKDSLQFFIEYDFLPKSVIPRFIVKMHKDIKGELRWRTGVFLEDSSFRCPALVEADERDKKIHINVWGDQRRDYFAVVRHALLSINSSFEKIRAVEKIPMPDQPGVTISYDHLIRLEQLGEETYIPDGSQKPYNVKNLLGNIQVESRTQEAMIQIIKKIMSESDNEETTMEKIKSTLILQPNFFGMGVDLTQLGKLVKKLFH